jgi:hypothetical protein
MTATGDPSGGRELQFHHVLRCPCGEVLTGDTEDAIVEVGFAHLRERHPDMADHYEREHILVMAQRLVRASGPQTEQRSGA